MRHIRILAVVLTVLMIGAVAADPVAARPHHFAKSSVHQWQKMGQLNVNHQSHNYGGVQISVQKNYDKQKAVSHASNWWHGGGPRGNDGQTDDIPDTPADG